MDALKLKMLPKEVNWGQLKISPWAGEVAPPVADCVFRGTAIECCVTHTKDVQTCVRCGCTAGPGCLKAQLGPEYGDEWMAAAVAGPTDWQCPVCVWAAAEVEKSPGKTEGEAEKSAVPADPADLFADLDGESGAGEYSVQDLWRLVKQQAGLLKLQQMEIEALKEKTAAPEQELDLRRATTWVEYARDPAQRAELLRHVRSRHGEPPEDERAKGSAADHEYRILYSAVLANLVKCLAVPSVVETVQGVVNRLEALRLRRRHGAEAGITFESRLRGKTASEVTDNLLGRVGEAVIHVVRQEEKDAEKARDLKRKREQERLEKEAKRAKKDKEGKGH